MITFPSPFWRGAYIIALVPWAARSARKLSAGDLLVTSEVINLGAFSAFESFSGKAGSRNSTRAPATSVTPADAFEYTLARLPITPSNDGASKGRTLNVTLNAFDVHADGSRPQHFTGGFVSIQVIYKLLGWAHYVEVDIGETLWQLSLIHI